MATSITRRFLVLLLCALACVHCVKDGTTVSQCDYPGIVAILSPSSDTVVCNGVRVGGVLYTSQLCGDGMDSMLQSKDLIVVYGDGTKNTTIPQGSSGSTTDGIYQIPIPGATEVDCNSDGILYDPATMELDTSTCELVAYGGTAQSSHIYDGVLNSAPITKSTSEPCCEVIYDSLTKEEKGVILDSTVPLNCMASSGAGCGTGDLGGPIYCETTTALRVVVGLTASTPCQSGGTFLVHDLTNSQESFKFGITA